MKLSWKTGHYVLVQQWTTSTTTGLVGAMVLSCVLAVGYELLRRFLSLWSRRKDLRIRHPVLVPLLQSTIYSTLVFISNILMLMIMTYNIWVFLCVLLGAGFGFFILPPTSTAGEIQARHTNPEKSGELEPKSVMYSSLLRTREEEDMEENEEEEPQQQQLKERANSKSLGGGFGLFDKNKNNHEYFTGSSSRLAYGHDVREEEQDDLIYNDDITTILESSPFKSTPELSTLI